MSIPKKKYITITLVQYTINNLINYSTPLRAYYLVAYYFCRNKHNKRYIRVSTSIFSTRVTKNTNKEQKHKKDKLKKGRIDLLANKLSTCSLPNGRDFYSY